MFLWNKYLSKVLDANDFQQKMTINIKKKIWPRARKNMKESDYLNFSIQIHDNVVLFLDKQS